MKYTHRKKYLVDSLFCLFVLEMYFDYFVLVMLQGGVTPDPIPNSAVKPSLAYDTWTQSGPGKVGCRQHKVIKLVWPSLASMIPNPVSFLGKVGCRQH